MSGDGVDVSTETGIGLVVAIDGPAGAGKSTVARVLANRLGLGYLDTGAMYRAVTLAALDRGIPVSDEAAVAEVAGQVDLDLDDGGVRLDGHDVSRRIRSREVTESVSAVAANPAVRRVLVQWQRAWAAAHGGGVLEGRDIGSVVFPDAAVKVFVTASPRVRAQRRVAELGGDVDDIEASIVERDRRDSTRDHSPLLEASGAVVVDTSDLSVDEVVERIVALVPR